MYEFDIGMDVVSIKDIGDIKRGTTCHISGCGTLNMFTSGGKTGYGFCLDYYIYNEHPKPCVKMDKYFTEQEMHGLFVPAHDWYDGLEKQYIREEKIDKLLN